MATSTILQSLDAGQSAGTSARSSIETYIAGGTIVAGDWVMIDVSQSGADKALYVVQASTAGNGLVRGVAKFAAAAGDQVDVVVKGYVAEANVLTATAAGVPLAISATAGRAAQATVDATGGATEPVPGICGTSLTVAADNKAEVIVG
jgi:hypothetical protein